MTSQKRPSIYVYAKTHTFFGRDSKQAIFPEVIRERQQQKTLHNNNKNIITIIKLTFCWSHFAQNVYCEKKIRIIDTIKCIHTNKQRQREE